uniref:Phosphatidylethanolamine N-methyltransferase n=1 Tax=Periophthalmus magnuspinnatus TaxID=409849 RepID=A0A3B3ZMV6_9GOBI
ETNAWISLSNSFLYNITYIFVARWEHSTRRLTALFGSPYVACYSLGFIILLLNVCRSHSMTVAMKTQPRWEVLEQTEVYYTGVVFMMAGTVLVVSSFLALGFTGTFLGDYFGILMDEKVTGFPFNLIDNPMYWGSTANYLGLALISRDPLRYGCDVRETGDKQFQNLSGKPQIHVGLQSHHVCYGNGSIS